MLLQAFKSLSLKINASNFGSVRRGRRRFLKYDHFWHHCNYCSFVPDEMQKNLQLSYAKYSWWKRSLWVPMDMWGLITKLVKKRLLFHIFAPQKHIVFHIGDISSISWNSIELTHATVHLFIIYICKLGKTGNTVANLCDGKTRKNFHHI